MVYDSDWTFNHFTYYYYLKTLKYNIITTSKSFMKVLDFFFFIQSYYLRPKTMIAIHLLHSLPFAFTGKNYCNMYPHYFIKLEKIFYAFVRDTNIDGT